MNEFGNRQRWMEWDFNILKLDLVPTNLRRCSFWRSEGTDFSLPPFLRGNKESDWLPTVAFL